MIYLTLFSFDIYSIIYISLFYFTDIDTILTTNEYTHEFDRGPVKSYESNQLASNSPIEDSRSEAISLLTRGLLFGVFDGHGKLSHILFLRKDFKVNSK